MKDRIILLIKAKNLTAAQFADEINVQKSSISHIISGRNNASLDFVQKVLLRYPEVNMDWLMFGKGPLFKETDFASDTSNVGEIKKVSVTSEPPVDLFSLFNPDQSLDFRKENELKSVQTESVKSHPEDTTNPSSFSVKENKEPVFVTTSEQPENVAVVSGHKNTQTKSVVKIVEFYSDNTYREYFPE